MAVSLYFISILSAHTSTHENFYLSIVVQWFKSMGNCPTRIILEVYSNYKEKGFPNVYFKMQAILDVNQLTVCVICNGLTA